jgi:hypothetical protein
MSYEASVQLAVTMSKEASERQRSMSAHDPDAGTDHAPDGVDERGRHVERVQTSTGSSARSL